MSNGNKYEVTKLRIERHDVYDDVMVTLYDELIDETECYAQHLTDESLERLADALPLTFTIYISYHDKDAGYSYPMLTVPIRANFDNDELEQWLAKNFPLFDWEPYENGYIWPFDDEDAYLYAVLLLGEG